MSLARAKKTSRITIPERKTNIFHSPFLNAKPIHNNFQEQLIQGESRCPCGGGCPGCRDNLTIQPKLIINEPGDKYEHEADRVGDEILQTSQPMVQRQRVPDIPAESPQSQGQTAPGREPTHSE